MITIRPIQESDAAVFLALRTQRDAETHLMMLEPGERSQDLEQQYAELRSELARANHTILLAVTEDQQLAGYLEAEGGRFRRNRHTAIIVLGILGAYRGQGIGTRLLQSIETWAKTCGVRRLELTVMVHNHAAQALYTKMGYVIEGRRQWSLLVDGAFVDEYSMAKLIPADQG